MEIMIFGCALIVDLEVAAATSAVATTKITSAPVTTETISTAPATIISALMAEIS